MKGQSSGKGLAVNPWESDGSQDSFLLQTIWGSSKRSKLEQSHRSPEGMMKIHVTSLVPGTVQWVAHAVM